MTAFGITCYVVTEAKHSAEVYKNTETLSFEDFVQGLMRTNGNKDSVIQTMYSKLPTNKDGFPNPTGTSLGVLAQRMHIHQLYPGPNLLALQQQVLCWIDLHVTAQSFRESIHPTKHTGPDYIQVPLYKWCSDQLVHLGQHVYFGDLLNEIDPTLPDAFFVFDELIWKMLYQYPGFLSHDMSVPRARIIASLESYLRVPQGQRSDSAAWLINAMEDEMRAVGIVDNHELAVLMFHLYFAINTNTRKTAFWFLTYLLNDPALMEVVRSETAPAFDGHKVVDPWYLQDAEKCPKVSAIWHETLRMAGWAASVRLVTRDTVIGGKLLRRGNRVLVPHRLLHFDETVFGGATTEFRPERWLSQNGSDLSKDRDLTKSPSWRPFGGGKTICSGRFLAKFTVTTFVATLLRRFDVEKVQRHSKFPRADEGRPVLGIMSIKEEDEFEVRLLPKVVLT